MDRVPHTKFTPPINWGATISRPRLDQWATTLESKPIVTVVAPAGSGKTTFMSHWHASLRKRGITAAWLSLDGKEQCTARFLSALVNATKYSGGLDSAFYDEHLLEPEESEVCHLIERYVSAISQRSSNIAVFIDDYHFAENQVNNRALKSLIHLTPACMNLIIGSRAVPDFGIPSLRAYNKIAEVTYSELSFNDSEITDFLDQVHDLRISPNDRNLLRIKTEGWIAGIQLASLSMKKSANPLRACDQFSGNRREVSDYLGSCILDSQTKQLRDFLLKTSFLDRFDIGMSSYVTGAENAGAHIAELESKNIFIVPLDDEGIWYRYHHLFQEFLRGKAKLEGEDIQRVNACAAEYCSQNHLIEDAVGYALAAGANDLAADLVAQGALALVYKGDIPRLVSWLWSIPAHIGNHHPRLPIIRCWALLHLGRSRESREIVALHKMKLRDQEICDAAMAATAGELAVMDISVDVASDCLEQVVARGPALIGELESTSLFLAGTVANFVALAGIATQNYSLSRHYGRLATSLHTQADSPYGKMIAKCLIAVADIQVGAFDSARALLLDAEQAAADFAGEGSLCLGLCRSLLGMCAYEAGDFDAAQALLEENVPLIRHCGITEFQRLTAVTLARLYSVRGQFDESLQQLKYLAMVARDDVAGKTRALAARESIRLFLRQGLSNEAKNAWSTVADLSLGADPAQWDRVSNDMMFSHIRILMEDRCWEEALRICDQCNVLLDQVEACLRDRIELQLIRDEIRQRRDVDAGSYSVLAPVNRHECAQVVALELGFGSIAETQASPSRGATRSRSAGRQSFKACGANATTAASPDAITARECDVLQLMVKGYRNAYIARELGLSEHTVKWHVRNILSKLGVENRTSAVIHAQQKGILIDAVHSSVGA